MADHVKSIPTDQNVQQICENINQIRTDLADSTVVLSKEQRQNLASARKGFERYLRMMTTIAKDNGIDLGSNPINSVIDDLTLQRQMDTLLTEVNSLLTMIQDTYRAARSNAWDTFRAYYRVLNAISQNDPKLMARMKPIVEFMANSQSKPNNNTETQTPTAAPQNTETKE